MNLFDSDEEKKADKKIKKPTDPNKIYRIKNKKNSQKDKTNEKPSPISLIKDATVKIKTLLLDQSEKETNLEEYLELEYLNFIEDSKSIPHFLSEDNEGNIEYKLKLVHPSEDRLIHLTTQMKYRLQEGNGEAIYEIGVEDNGNPLGLCKDDMKESLKTIYQMSSNLKADAVILSMKNGYKGKIAEILVRKNQKDGIKIDIRIVLMGEEDSGKSTLIGVLTSGQLDDGKGSARTKIFTSKQEFLTGKTSSNAMKYHILGFDSQGKITNNSMFGVQSWEQIVDQSTKIIKFIDLGGKIIFDGLCSQFPEFCLLCISSQTGISKNSIEYLKYSLIIQIPIIIVITQIDLINEQSLEEIVYGVQKMIKNVAPNKIPLVVRDEESVVLFSRMLLKEQILPIFLVSNKTGHNINLITSFFNLLPATNIYQSNVNLNTEYYIHGKYETNGLLILAGTVIKGTIKKHQIVRLGPDNRGNFYEIEVLGIQCQRVPVNSSICGQSCTISIKLGKSATKWLEKFPDGIRRGMVLVDGKSNPRAAFEFLAEIWMWEKTSEAKQLQKSYQPVINTQTTKQACTIIFENTELKELLLLKNKSKSIDMKKEEYDKREKHKNSFKEVVSATQKQRKKKNNKSVQEIINEIHDEKQLEVSNDIKNKNDKKEKNCNLKNSPIKQKKDPIIIIHPNQKNLLRLRFMYYPEYIQEGQKLLINDTSLKSVGWIKEIYY